MVSFGLAVLLIAAASGAAIAGEISGTVRDASKGGAPVAGADVVLAARSTDGGLERHSTTTDAAGRYRFTGLSEDSTVIYVVNVRYGDVDHPSPFLALTPEKALVVHDVVIGGEAPVGAGAPMGAGAADGAGAPTGAAAPAWAEAPAGAAAPMEAGAPAGAGGPEAVRIEAAHWIVAAGEDAVEITEIYSIVHQDNPADGDGIRVRFALPAGYHEFAGREGIDQAAVRLDETGFVLDKPLAPGPHEFIFSYHLPASRYPVRIEHAISYPAPSLDVLVHPETATVGSETLTMHGVESLGERSYLYLSQENVRAGEPVSLVLSFPGSGDALEAAGGGGIAAPLSRGLGTGMPLAVALGVGLLFGVPVLRITAGRRSKAGEMAASRRRLVEEIAVLDLRCEAGGIPEADYRAARTALLNRLHILARKMEEDEDA